MNVYIVEQFIKVLLIKKVSIMLHSIYSLFMCIHMHASRWKIKENALYLIFFGVFSPHSHFNFLWQWQQCWICRGKGIKKASKWKRKFTKEIMCDVHCGNMRMRDIRGNHKEEDGFCSYMEHSRRLQLTWEGNGF